MADIEIFRPVSLRNHKATKTGYIRNEQAIEADKQRVPSLAVLGRRAAKSRFVATSLLGAGVSEIIDA